MILPLALAVLLLGCTHPRSLAAALEPSRPDAAPAPGTDAGVDAALEARAVPPAEASFRVTTWNVEWFGDAERGPVDDGAQLEAVTDVLLRWPSEIVALQEVSDEDAFAALRARLGGVEGVLSSGPATQRLALLYTVARFELLSLERLDGLDDAGRPPLLATLRDRASTLVLEVVVVHAKAGSDAASWEQRRRFADALGARLDARSTGRPVLVLGDLNDELERSLLEGRASPYAAWIDERDWLAPTRVLEAEDGERTTIWDANVDHVVVSASLAPAVWPASIDVLGDELLARDADYGEHVSDHFPVTLRLASPRAR